MPNCILHLPEFSLCLIIIIISLSLHLSLSASCVLVRQGCVSQGGEQASNVARNCVLASKLPESVPGTSLDRCSCMKWQSVFAAVNAL